MKQHPAKLFRVSGDVLDILIGFDWSGDDEIIQTKNVQNHAFCTKNHKSTPLTVGHIRLYSMRSVGTMESSSTTIPKVLFRYAIVRRYTYSTSERTHDECNRTPYMELFTSVTSVQHDPTVYGIVRHAGVHAGTSSYHNLLGRTQSYSTRSVGTME